MLNELQNNLNDINSAYHASMQFAKKHYENFPVVSFLIPKGLGKHIAIIYWFARTADDLADEGNISAEERINQLNHFESRLNELLKGNYESSLEIALHSTIKEKNLSPSLFFDLLKAFKQDVFKKRYKDFDDVLEYCKFSANPVGRLILELYGIRSEEAFYYSDKICTALQLTNFYQDTAIDFQKGRIYLPQDEMEKFGIEENLFELKENNLKLKQLLKHNINRTRVLFDDGKNLLRYLNGMLKLEIKWTVLGGEAVLTKIEKNNYDVLNKRPALTKINFIALFLKAFLK